MATHKYTTSSHGDNPTQDIEHLKAEIHTLFLDYIRLRGVTVEALADVRYAEHHLKPLSEREALRAEFEARREAALAAKHAILALTAPAGGVE